LLPHLILTPARLLSLAGFLTAADIGLRRLGAVAGGQVDFECDKLIP
jgi:hypothetical protein